MFYDFFFAYVENIIHRSQEQHMAVKTNVNFTVLGIYIGISFNVFKFSNTKDERTGV